jgi:hypothetical protein
LFEKFEQACYMLEGVECWSAHEPELIPGYSKWENFEKVIFNVFSDYNKLTDFNLLLFIALVWDFGRKPEAI